MKDWKHGIKWFVYFCTMCLFLFGCETSTTTQNSTEAPLQSTEVTSAVAQVTATPVPTTIPASVVVESPVVSSEEGVAVNTEGNATLPAYGVVIADSLNVRAEPTTQAELVGGVFQGHNMEILAQEGEWYQIRANGIVGYVKAEFVKIIGEKLTTTSGDIYFYDALADEFKTVNKTFYWATFSRQPRRFDAKLSSDDFDIDTQGKVTISADIQQLTNKMGQALYKSESFSVNCYFGQYYPSEKNEEGIAYETGIHEGIDFGGPALDAPFYSLTDGVVTSVNIPDGNGEYAWIAVETGDYTVFYVHASSSEVKTGDTVIKGGLLGKQGDKGAPDSYHVHVELVKGKADHFNYSKDTELINDSPYDFWREQMN